MELISLEQIKATEKQKDNINKSKLEYLIKYIAKDNDCYLATRFITVENKNNS